MIKAVLAVAACGSACLAFAQVSLRARLIQARIAHTYSDNACDLEYYVNGMLYTATNIQLSPTHTVETPLVQPDPEEPRKLVRVEWERTRAMHAAASTALVLTCLIAR